MTRVLVLAASADGVVEYSRDVDPSMHWSSVAEQLMDVAYGDGADVLQITREEVAR